MVGSLDLYLNLRLYKKNSQSGFTLIELVIIIVVLGIIASVAIPKFADISDSSKVTATKKEMSALKRSIIGNPDIIAGGQLIDRGFEGDVGFVPSLLADLVVKPDSVAVYNKLTRLGWNGSYMDSSEGLYLKDAWDVNYVYQPLSRNILSVGGDDTIMVNF